MRLDVDGGRCTLGDSSSKKLRQARNHRQSAWTVDSAPPPLRALGPWRDLGSENRRISVLPPCCGLKLGYSDSQPDWTIAENRRRVNACNAKFPIRNFFVDTAAGRVLGKHHAGILEFPDRVAQIACSAAIRTSGFVIVRSTRYLG